MDTRSLALSSAALLLASLTARPAHADAAKDALARARAIVTEVKDRIEEQHGVTRVALIGDLPYRDTDIAKLDEVLREINASTVDFTVHTGDIKSGSSLCADELFKLPLRPAPAVEAAADLHPR